METIELKKNDVIELHKGASKEGKEILEKLMPKWFLKPITERVKTMEDVCNVLGISYLNLMEQCSELPKDEAGYKKVKLIAQALNEGWKPDWENSREKKHYPWLHFVSGSGFSFGACICGHTYSLVCSRLCFKSRELCEYAVKQFEKEYRELFDY